ncbi:MAG TPA: DNA topoisomerase VI subunit B [Thermoprotei archaeon]|nr:DNA topoisomerase VI subunit B [Thermoprotei archaeon]
MSKAVYSTEKYKGLSPAEFFYRNKEMAGFSNPIRAVYQTIRELLENSLDATELHGILPEIEISIMQLEDNLVRIRVKDNGIGIPEKEVPLVFGRVFYGSKYDLRQSRGVFGLGIKMALLYSQITTGKPIYIMSSTTQSTTVYEYELMIDISKNIPIVLKHSIYKKRDKFHGTIVDLSLEGNWIGARKRVLEYIKRTAIIAPYAKIIFKTPDMEINYDRVTKILPQPPRYGKPHPYGIDLEMLKRLISECNSTTSLRDFLLNMFEGIGEKTVRDFLKWAGLNGSSRVKSFTLKELNILARKLREYPGWRRPRAIPLSPIGEKLLREGIKKILKPEYVTAVTRRPSSYRGHPFIVEAAIAIGGEIPLLDKPLLLRYANKIPLLYDEGADVARKVLDSINWNYYKVKFPNRIAVLVHLCSTKIPFKGVGKEAIADVPEIENEIDNAIKDCARRLRRHISRTERIYRLRQKKTIIMKYLPEVIRSLKIITNVDEDILKNKILKILERELERRSMVRIDGKR